MKPWHLWANMKFRSEFSAEVISSSDLRWWSSSLSWTRFCRVRTCWTLPTVPGFGGQLIRQHIQHHNLYYCSPRFTTNHDGLDQWAQPGRNSTFGDDERIRRWGPQRIMLLQFIYHQGTVQSLSCLLFLPWIWSNFSDLNPLYLPDKFKIIN